MKKIVLLLLAALFPLVMGASAADAQHVGHGHYRGDGYYGGARFVGGPRYFYGPRRFVRYGGFVPGYPYFAGYAGAGAYGGGCYRWRITPTSIGPQWRMVNLCYAPVYAVPAVPVYY